MSRVPFQAINRCCCFVITLLAVVALIERAFAFTNCFTAATCAPGQSCNDDCIDVWSSTPDPIKCPPAPGGCPCVLWKGSTANPTTPTFLACIPSSTATNPCQYTPVNPPITICGTGNGYFCTCRDVLSGNCLNGAVIPACSCGGLATYPSVFITVDATC